MRSAQDIWEAALGELQLQVNKPNFQTWFRGTKALSYQGDRFIIGVSNTFVAEYLDRNQRSLIEKTLISLTNRNVNAVFKVNSTAAEAAESPRQEDGATDAVFNARYTFDSFIVGGCNRMAHAAALSAVQHPGKGYNPLFI